MDGSAIHNRLKYLGIIDKSSLSNTINIDKIYRKNIDSDNKYKYLVFNDYSGIRQYKTKPNTNANDMYLSNSYNNYNSNYKPQVRDFSSSIYDNYNTSYYTPLNSKKYGKTMNFHPPYPHEYQVYYFPTSKPIAQYPRQTTERFYTRKPIKQYPEEEVPYLPIRYSKPVRVVEQESSFSLDDYDYRIGNKNIEPYTPEYRARYVPANGNMFNSYDDNSYYYEPDLRHRSFSSITRPCSPVYIRDPLFNRNNLSNSESLLEKKIRDYVWNPYKRRVEKYAIPNYEKSTYSNFKPLSNKHEEDEIYRTRSGFDSQLPNHKNEVIKDDVYSRNTRKMSPERTYSYEENVKLQNDDDILENPSYKKKDEKPVPFPKRISFDLHNEDTELPTRNNSIEENTDENPVTKERKFILGRQESNTKLDDNRRTSLLSNDNYSISSGKQRVLPSEINGNSRRKSSNKQEKLPSIGNSLKSDKYFNSKNNFLENDSNLLHKNVHNNNIDVEKIKYDDHNNVNDLYPKTRDDKHNYNMVKDVSNINAQRSFRRDSNDNSRRKLRETNENLYINNQDQAEIISNKTDNLNTIKKRERFKNEQKFKNETFFGSKKNVNNVDNNVEKENHNYTSGLNEPSQKIISSTPIIDHNNDIPNIEQYNAVNKETAYLQPFIIDDTHTNNSETTLSYQMPNDSNKEMECIRDNSDFKTIQKELEPSTEILNDNHINNTNYYQDYSNNKIEEHPTYEIQSENVDKHVTNDDNYYTNELVNNNNEKIVEPIQLNEFVDEKSAHDEYYYQNPTDDIKEKSIENQYENINLQENNVENTHANDDYYYQNNYSNLNSKEQTENQYAESGQQDYVPEQNNHDDYYYQDHARDDEIKEQQGDVQYANPTDYQGDYTDQQQPTEDYYYQNYSNVDPKGQPESQYAESSHQAEYGDENIENNEYYYQNHPEENSDENQINQHYSDPAEIQKNYVNGEQENYYYEDNSNVNSERRPSGQYDENFQQGSYADDQHANDNYYYQSSNENYDSIAKEQYDGYVGDQHEVNDPAYYPDSQSNNYDLQHNSYDNNTYQTQQSDYVEPYVQNPTNESYDYSDNIAESQSTNHISDDQSK